MVETQNTGGREAHAANVARWPHVYREPCQIVPADWPYDCLARDRHPDHDVFRCEPHGVWWHEPGSGQAHEPEVPEVVKTYRSGSGAVDAVTLRAADGAEFTVRLSRRQVSGADERVWAHPERYGIDRWYCPGHGPSGICPYGMHDENRYTGPIPEAAL